MKDELVNLGFYRFCRLSGSELPGLRAELRQLCRELDLKGTILLAAEGLNVMLTGSRESIEKFKLFAQEHFGVHPRSYKENSVVEHSFNRMLIKIKKEIISVGDSELRPDERTATRLAPATLKAWLDEGRDVLLVDTRNQYEVDVGTFKGALELGLENSRQFAEKAAENLAAWKDRPVVTFCTGGIRCEKASALLLKMGLKDDQVFQLDGGILRYFEEEGAAHFDGNCFVFDWRLAVDGKLEKAERASVTAAENSEAPVRQFGRHLLPQS